MKEDQEFVLVWCQKVISKDHTLLILKDRPDWQKGRLNLPGGKIEDGETPLEAAHRELYEETGLKCINMTLSGKMIDKKHIIWITSASIAGNAKLRPCDHETEIPSWKLWNHVKDDPILLPNLRVIIPMLMAGIKDFTVNHSYTKGEITTLEISVPDQFKN